MIKAREATAVLLLALVLLGGCGKKGEQRAGSADRQGEIVRVGSASLAGEDIARLVPEDERIPLTFEERREFVRRWVDTEVLCQEAIRRGFKNDPYVEARLTELEEQFLADYLVFTELRARTRVSEEEIEAYYAAHEHEYLSEYRVSQILVNTPEDAATVLDLLKTKSWDWVASRYSVDPVAKRGGDLGYLTKGNMIPELEAVIFDLKPGETTGVIKSDFGYHIFKLVDVRDALVAVGLDDVREQIMNTLMLEKRRNAYHALLDSLRARADISYKDKSYMRPIPPEPPADTIGPGGEVDTTLAP
jgi:peptidyl-prolyl cis-trans isomerase C